MSVYAWLMLISLSVPLMMSFHPKVAYFRWWPALFTGIGLNLILFVVWDSWFVTKGIWGFNPKYVWPQRLLNLPLEEWLFFLVVPYCSIFIYASLKTYVSDRWWVSKVRFINYFFIIFCFLHILVFSDQTYTLVNFSLALILLLIQQFWIKGKYMAYFWMAYFVHLIPFFVVNGILTGAVTPEPIVWYNPKEIIGIRLYTIPLEDTIYALTCLLLPITLTEYLRNRKNKNFASAYTE